MKEFLGFGGMEKLLALLKHLGSPRSNNKRRKQSRRCHSATSVHVALQQLQCVACVKAVANSAGGLKFIAGDEKHVGLFAQSELQTSFETYNFLYGLKLKRNTTDICLLRLSDCFNLKGPQVIKTN